MMRYLIAGEAIEGDAPELQQHLAAAYKARQRPQCLCKGRGSPVPMYLAKHGQTVVLKRMPNSGATHGLDCDHYEVPPAVSGRGALEETAIKEDAASGETELRVDFALKKMPGRAPPTSGGESGDDVKNDAQKLTILSTLHYLWDEAGLNRWTPAMAGKRNWSTVYRHVGKALHGKRTKGAALADAVLLPEPFRLDAKDEHEKHVRARIAPLARTNPPQLLLCIGELKALEPSRFGCKLQVKHLPEVQFFLEEDVAAKIRKRYAPAFEVASADDQSHLVVGFTFSVKPSGACHVERAAMMACDANWLPCESVPDLELTRLLVEQGRRFRKGMRYNLAKSKALACAVLTDTEQPTGLFVAPLSEDPEGFREEAEALASDAELIAWIWCPGDEERPNLPAPREAHSA